jgi:hypothetical protein
VVPGDLAPGPKRRRAGEWEEVQNTRCTTPGYSSLPMCVSCSKNKGSVEHCRFRKARLVARSASGAVRSLESFVSGTGLALSRGKLAPTAAEKKAAACVLQYACRPLLELIEEEQALLPVGAKLTIATAQLSAASVDPASEVRAAVEHRAPGERQLCDYCDTTIMCHYAACPQCGYEACLDCASEWRLSGVKPPCVARDCPHSIDGWQYFSRIDPNTLERLRRKGKEWSGRVDGGGGESSLPPAAAAAAPPPGVSAGRARTPI